MRLGLACLILVTGCDLYFTDDDDDPPCAIGAAEFSPAEQLRNPDTGVCQGFGSPPCDGVCGPCEFDLAPPPDWGSCFAGCEALDEQACVDQPGCRVAYVSNLADDGGFQFRECWSIAPSGPAPGGCENLDAYECSRHDNCSAFYQEEEGVLTFFECRVEAVKTCFSDEECGDNAHCSTSDGECLPAPGCDDGACEPVCYGRCVSDGDVCSNVACGPGTHCEAQCHPCDGTNGPCDPFCSPVCVPDTNACAAIDCAPGFECVETCQSEDPNNPGCGICDATCVPVGTCESLQTEAECLGRGDCTTVYTGENCTCYGNGTCDCEVLTYERCEAK